MKRSIENRALEQSILWKTSHAEILDTEPQTFCKNYRIFSFDRTNFDRKNVKLLTLLGIFVIILELYGLEKKEFIFFHRKMRQTKYEHLKSSNVFEFRVFRIFELFGLIMQLKVMLNFKLFQLCLYIGQFLTKLVFSYDRTGTACWAYNTVL